MAIFTAKFQVTGSKRKELVNCISEALERPAKYLGAPTFSYQVDYITIDRNGTISFDDSANTEEIEHLFDYLDAHGFGTETSETCRQQTTPLVEENATQGETAALTVQIPRDKVNPKNLMKLLQGKEAQFDACVSLAYNIGTGAFANSDIVSFINAGKIGHACVDFPSWRLSGGQILIGLQKRRQIEMEFFGLGEDFTLNDTMNIRSGPGTENSIRKVSQITANGRECVADKTANANAMFKPGTVVTALELKAIYTTASIDVWLRCPSGWICARQNKDVFIK